MVVYEAPVTPLGSSVRGRRRPVGAHDLLVLREGVHGLVMGGGCQRTHTHEVMKPIGLERAAGGHFRAPRVHGTTRFFEPSAGCAAEGKPCARTAVRADGSGDGVAAKRMRVAEEHTVACEASSEL